MDFANFRDNNLPEGWDDDWSGDFQLLDSRLYNESKYYVRSNITYESPLLASPRSRRGLCRARARLPGAPLIDPGILQQLLRLRVSGVGHQVCIRIIQKMVMI